MADPKTGQIADPDDFATPVDPNATPDKPAPTGYVKTPFDLAREEMAKRAHKRRMAAEGSLKVDTLEEDGSITPAEEPAPVAAAPEESTEPDSLTLDTRRDAQAAAVDQPPAQVQATDVSPASVPPTAPEEERELIVDGKRIRVPLSKILDAGTRTIQKESAADMRLAAATELLRSAQERQAAPPPAPVVAQPSDDDAALARQIQFGTEAEASAAIAKLRNAAPAITPQQIEAYVQQQLTQRLPDHNAFHEANAWLAATYSDIKNDPDLKAMFDMKEEQARKAGDRRPYKELYADLAGQMATKFNLKRADAPQAAQPMQTADRLTRKAASPRAVTGASGRIEQAPQPRKAPTVAEYVSQQRQRRGLQPLEKGTQQ